MKNKLAYIGLAGAVGLAGVLYSCNHKDPPQDLRLQKRSSEVVRKLDIARKTGLISDQIYSNYIYMIQNSKDQNSERQYRYFDRTEEYLSSVSSEKNKNGGVSSN